MAKAKALGVNHAPDLKVGAIEYHIIRKICYKVEATSHNNL